MNLSQADTATRAVALSSYHTCARDGIDLLRTRGPLMRLAVGNDPADVQLVHDLSTYAYDEDKPDGVTYHLVTTTTDALLLAGTAPEQLVDVVVARNRYAPIDGPRRSGPPRDGGSGRRPRWSPTPAPTGAISTGAYAATGNRARARQMTIVSAAAFVGAVGAVRAGFALAEAAGNTAARVGEAPVRMVQGANRSGGQGA
ncbi:hypothetical protein [Blastococcus capsensis]|uniref:hypothetical protein n=1 Tax=Blastococcus capsensis TaxID=1564163 RepID=UPI0025413F00|nr:hypothetical protein [Blastococcus capsensis]MDK3257515.1 hypothetical protein [Blastococcus capsensis]